MFRISRAIDNVFRKVSSQDPGAFLNRSDYPHIYDMDGEDDIGEAFNNGWHHYPDEPDLLHKTTNRGMTFSIHPHPGYGKEESISFPLYLHNPEGISLTGNFGSLSEAMNAENDITSGRRKAKELLSPEPHQAKFVRLIHDTVKNGGQVREPDGWNWTEDMAREALSRQKASEEAIAAGGESLRKNLAEAHRRRGWL